MRRRVNIRRTTRARTKYVRTVSVSGRRSIRSYAFPISYSRRTLPMPPPLLIRIDPSARFSRFVNAITGPARFLRRFLRGHTPYRSRLHITQALPLSNPRFPITRALPGCTRGAIPLRSVTR